MKTHILITISLIWSLNAQSQDSLKKAEPKFPKHELGLGLLYPTLIVLGGQNQNFERYTNLTYRWWFKEKHSLKVLAGLVFPGSMNSFTQTTVVMPDKTQLIANSYTQSPSNCQFGIGYEYYIGHKNLKLFAGADLIYNNQFVKKTFYYTNAKDSVANSLVKLDTGAYVSGRNYDKMGFNLNFGVRYEFNRQWAITAHCSSAFRFVQSKQPDGRTRKTFDFNTNGLVSDISLFYRFGH